MARETELRSATVDFGFRDTGGSSGDNMIGATASLPTATRPRGVGVLPSHFIGQAFCGLADVF